MQISINNTLFARLATVCWWHVPRRQQKIESIRDRIRWAVWTVVITENNWNRFEIDPIWTQSGFKLNRTNLNRSQSIYMWTQSKSYILNIKIRPLVTEYALRIKLVGGTSSSHSFNPYAYFDHLWSYFDIKNIRLLILYTAKNIFTTLVAYITILAYKTTPVRHK